MLIDYSTVEKKEDQKPENLPDGIYSVNTEEFKFIENNFGSSLLIKFRVMEGEEKGRSTTQFLTISSDNEMRQEIGRKMIRDLLEACDADLSFDPENDMHLASLFGKQMNIILKSKTIPDGRTFQNLVKIEKAQESDDVPF